MVRSDRKPRRRLAPGARRAAILSAAIEAFTTQPYPEVTIATIAASVGASNALVYRYFTSKEELYGEVVRLAIAELADRQAQCLAGLPAGLAARERLKAVTAIYLDHIASHPQAWALPLRWPGMEPAAVAELRAQARQQYVAGLADLLQPGKHARHDYALWGYLGFLDVACLRWVDAGCPPDERWPLIEAALGALEGALGDWAA